MNLLTERRLRYVLALRRVREATLLRDSDKVSELMNFHRRSDTPLGPPVCLKPADRLVAYSSRRVVVLFGRHAFTKADPLKSAKIATSEVAYRPLFSMHRMSPAY